MTVNPCATCGAPASKRYGTGWQCPDHTPAAMAGRPEAEPRPHPDPPRAPVLHEYGTNGDDPLGRTVYPAGKRFGIPKRAD